VTPRFLLDTHVLIWWLGGSKRLSAEHRRVIRNALHHRELVAISAITLLEIAVLGQAGSRRQIPADKVLSEIDSSQDFQILPLTVEIAAEVIAMGRSLQDPVDRVIVATARIHGLRLITADQRIIESKLVPIVV